MKKLKYLLLILLAVLVLPFSVLADEEEATESVDEGTEVVEETITNEVVVYFFRGEGCSHCAEAEEWFESIEEELGFKYVIKDYETWYDEENSKLMTKVAKVRQEEETATGVPYIIIGDKSWIGFDETYTSEIIDQINTLYEVDPAERYDVMTFVANMPEDEVKSSNDILSLVIIILVAGASVGGIIYARKQNAQ